MNKKNIGLWVLYDFANSIMIIVFFLYFSQWLVVDKGVSDFWYNMIFTGASVLLLITAPVIGSISDKTGSQESHFKKITLLAFLFFLLTSIIALFFSGSILLAVLFFLLAGYFYQFSFVFYNALLHHIAPPEKWGRISGFGQAGNWLGQIAGLLIATPFAAGAVYLFGEVGRAQTFLPSVVLFFLLALPMLLFFKLRRNKAQKAVSETISLKDEYKNQWQKFKDLIREPGMGLFLLSYFFFNDAVITALNNFPIFLEQVFSVTDSVKALLFMSILVTSAVGAIGSGYIADRFGLKRTLVVILSLWVIVFPLLGSTHNFTLFVIFCVLVGFLFGAVWTVTRATMTALCPPEKLNYGFSFYTLAERVSTFVGPLSWGIIASLFVQHGPVRYRIAMSTLAIFVLIGLIIFRKVHIKKKPENHSPEISL